MITLAQVAAVRDGLAAQNGGSVPAGLPTVVRKMPSAVRRMGLVRALEWLEAGRNNRELGTALYKALAPLLRLPTGSIGAAVKELETCDRRTLLAHHRRAIAVFDRLDLTLRAMEAE